MTEFFVPAWEAESLADPDPAEVERLIELAVEATRDEPQ